MIRFNLDAREGKILTAIAKDVTEGEDCFNLDAREGKILTRVRDPRPSRERRGGNRFNLDAREGRILTGRSGLGR